jgi:hypothetical protein
LHNIRKSIQPTLCGGVYLKLEVVLSFLGTMKNLFEEELLEKENLGAIFILFA